ncbi:MAG: hypothetical protein HS115_08240 [Spirochaetales bacterium]|nr:hypothetical protein [Spirochaetales bacterium]
MNRLLLYIEIVYISLQAPGELTGFLARLPEARRYSFISLFFISLSLTVGRLIVSTGGPWSAMLLAGLFLHGALLFIFLVLFSLVLTFLAGRSGLDAARLEITIQAAIHSALPLCFSTPAALLAHFFLLPWLFPLLTGLLFFWSLANVIVFFQYQQEQSLRLVIRQAFFSLLLVISFPFLFASGFLMQLLA